MLFTDTKIQINETSTRNTLLSPVKIWLQGTLHVRTVSSSVNDIHLIVVKLIYNKSDVGTCFMLESVT